MGSALSTGDILRCVPGLEELHCIPRARGPPTPFALPLRISAGAGERLRLEIRRPAPIAFQGDDPAVAVSFAVGTRALDATGSGPGLIYARGVVEALHAAKINCAVFSDMDEDDSWRGDLPATGAKDGCKVFVAIVTPAFSGSPECLVHLKDARQAELICKALRFEPTAPPSSGMSRHSAHEDEDDDDREEGANTTDGGGGEGWWTLETTPSEAGACIPDDATVLTAFCEDLRVLLTNLALEDLSARVGLTTAALRVALQVDLKDVDPLEENDVRALAMLVDVNPHLEGVRLGDAFLDIKAFAKQDVSLASAELCDKCARFVARMVAGRPVTALDLSNNRIQDAGVRALAQAVRLNPGLTQLNLLRNDFTDDAARALVLACELEGSHVVTLCGISAAEGEAASARVDRLSATDLHLVAYDVTSNPTLTSLDLSGGRLVAGSTGVLAAALDAADGLTELHLNENGLGDEGTAALAGAMASHESLQVLHANGCDMGDEGAKAIAQAMAGSLPIRELGLSSNRIGDKGAQAIAAALVQVPSLEELYLSANNLGDIAGMAFGRALKDSESLRILWLNDNKIADRGGKGLAKNLRSNSQLQELWLHHNQLGDLSAAAFAKALEGNSTLRVLQLGSNSITDKGVAPLAHALLQNRGLRRLALGGNLLTDASASEIASALRINPVIEEIHVESNYIGREGIVQIGKVLREVNRPNLKVYRR